ncbi:MAG: hypothetical protein IIZ93_14710 [Acidaminococcaceae bacterium]|nr:hypothetical protein [Acidaminococcaceae bacterium]
MKIKLFDNITVTAEPEEVYMLLKLHHKALQKSEGPKLTITSNGIQYTAGGITQAPTDPFIADQLIAPETPESAAHSMVETPEAKPAPVKRPVDWGKAKALRKAGWSLAKIADELGVSVPTVSAHLKEVKA